MERLNAKGVRLLVTLLRYVEQHGNVTFEAKESARLLRAAAGDYAGLKFDEATGRLHYEGEAKTPQEDLAAAMKALRLAAPKRDAAEAQGSSPSSGEPI